MIKLEIYQFCIKNLDHLTINALQSYVNLDLVSDLSKLLQGTAKLLKNIAEAKKKVTKTIAPAIETAAKIKNSLTSSETLQNIIKTKTAVVRSLAESAPQIGTMVSSVAKAIPSLIKEL